MSPMTNRAEAKRDHQVPTNTQAEQVSDEVVRQFNTIFSWLFENGRERPPTPAIDALVASWQKREDGREHEFPKGEQK